MMAFVCRHCIDSLVHFQWTVCVAHARAHSQGSCPSSRRSMASIFEHLIYSRSLQRPDQSVWCLDVRWKISLASSCFIDRNHSMAPPSCFQPRNCLWMSCWWNEQWLSWCVLFMESLEPSSHSSRPSLNLGTGMLLANTCDLFRVFHSSFMLQTRKRGIPNDKEPNRPHGPAPKIIR